MKGSTRWLVKLTIRGATALMFLLFLGLQYQLWFDNGGLQELVRLKKAIAVADIQNARLAERNNLLKVDVKDLRRADEGVEERARNVLGMVKDDETFFQVVD